VGAVGSGVECPTGGPPLRMCCRGARSYEGFCRFLLFGLRAGRSRSAGLVEGLRLCRGAKVKEGLFRSFAFRTSVLREYRGCGPKAAFPGAVNQISRYFRTNETSE
jgi:hypothetical protein